MENEENILSTPESITNTGQEKPSEKPTYNKSKYSNEELLNHLKELAIKLGRTPSYNDINANGKIKAFEFIKCFGKISSAQKAAGFIPSIGGNFYKPKYSDEDLINHLKELSIKLNRTPKSKDIKGDGKISLNIYYKHFDSLSSAQKAAGLIPSIGGIVYNPKYSNEDLINHLKELAIKIGRTPTGNDINENDKIKLPDYIKCFGKISIAQRAAGLIPSPKGSNKTYMQKYSNEDLLNHLKELAIKLGRTPMVKDMNDDGKISINLYYKCFGSFSNSHKVAGLIPTKRGRIKDKNIQQKYSNEDLLNHLKELATKLGRTPKIKDIKDDGKINILLYFERFGKLSNAQKEAGLIQTKRGNVNKSNYSGEDLLNYLKELAIKLGRTPIIKNIIDDGKTSYNLYIRRFGSFSNAQKEAGLIPTFKGNVKYQKYSNEDLLNHLKELAIKLGRTPTIKNIKDDGKTSYNLYFRRFGSFSNAQMAAGLILTKKTDVNKSKYSNEDLLNHLKELAIKHGRTPIIKDIKDDGKINYNLYIRRFGSFSSAQKEAGLITTKMGNVFKPKCSDEVLLNNLKELAIKLGRTPSYKDIKNDRKIFPHLYIKRYGSLTNAQKEAGLIASMSKPKYSDEDLLNHLKELSLKLGRTPIIKDIKNDGKINSNLYYKSFGSLVNAQKAAGLVPSIRGVINNYLLKYSNEDLITYLKEFATKLGKTPSMKDIKDDGKINAHSYIKRFGSLSNAQKEAGLIPTIRGIVNKPKYSNEDLLNHLKELSIKLGRTPSFKDIKDEGKISSKSYYVRFVSLTEAQKAAGLIPTLRGNVNHQKYSDEILLNHLKELATKLGRTPSTKDIKDEGKINYHLYIKRFGSLSNAQKAAGLIPTSRGIVNKPKYSNEELLNYLKELALKLGRTPTTKDIKDDGKISSKLYYVNFVSLTEAQKAAGLIPNKKRS